MNGPRFPEDPGAITANPPTSRALVSLIRRFFSFFANFEGETGAAGRPHLHVLSDRIADVARFTFRRIPHQWVAREALIRTAEIQFRLSHQRPRTSSGFGRSVAGWPKSIFRRIADAMLFGGSGGRL